jgi:hypothetical protein
VIESLIYMIAARVIVRRYELHEALGVIRALSAQILRVMGEEIGDDQERMIVEEMKSALVWFYRWSRVLGGDCKERALSGRLWMARRGVRSQVVVGVRSVSGQWEGHAWLEGERWRLFVDEGNAGYKELFREGMS